MKPNEYNKLLSQYFNLSVFDSASCGTKSHGSVKIEKSDWLSTKEAAEFLKISVMTLRNMASNGRIPYYKLGRSNRYSQKELENFLLKNKRGNIYGN